MESTVTGLQRSLNLMSLGQQQDTYSQEAMRYQVQAQEKLASEMITQDNPFAFLTDPKGFADRIHKEAHKIAIGNSFPSLTPNQLDQFLDLMIKEFHGGNIQITNAPGDKRDYGYSFIVLSHCQRALLGGISQHFHQTGNRPKVGDFGAGHGIMSWKILALGGDLVCLEQQKPTAAMIGGNLIKAKPFMGGTLIKSVCHTLIGDALNSTSNAYKQSYDFTWSGNLLHFFTPSQAAQYVNNLFSATNPGGYAYATVQSPDSKELIQFISNQKELGNTTSPGFIITDVMTTGEVLNADNHRDTLKGIDTTGKIIFKNAITSLVPVAPATEDYLPQDSRKGPFNSTTPVAETRFFPDGHVENVSGHQSIMYFEPDSLRSLFENAGFIVEDVFYELAGEKISASFGPEIGRSSIKLSIIAKKPSTLSTTSSATSSTTHLG